MLQLIMITRKFSNASLHSKVMLFKANRTQIYGCPLWSAMFKYSYNNLRVAYNDACRLLLKESRWCSASKLFVLHSVMSNVLLNPVHGSLQVCMLYDLPSVVLKTSINVLTLFSPGHLSSLFATATTTLYSLLKNCTTLI